jgi:hypothetical protein
VAQGVGLEFKKKEKTTGADMPGNEKLEEIATPLKAFSPKTMQLVT